MMNLLRIALLAVGCMTIGCGHSGPRRFALADPLWEDSDQNHVLKIPSEYYTGLASDVADKTIFHPLARIFRFPLPGNAVNVNAVDEVPNSSWFTNRIGMFAMTLDDVAKGACEGPQLDPKQGPWVVVSAKPNGANPGFFIKSPTGRYLLKFDGPVRNLREQLPQM